MLAETALRRAAGAKVTGESRVAHSLARAAPPAVLQFSPNSRACTDAENTNEFAQEPVSKRCRTDSSSTFENNEGNGNTSITSGVSFSAAKEHSTDTSINCAICLENVKIPHVSQRCGHICCLECWQVCML
jgi:hypothetical protein